MLNSYHIAQERIIIESDLTYSENTSQYERKLMNQINNENHEIEDKVRILSRAAIYLNKPSIWYLWCHYSLEDERKHDKKFLLYLFSVMKQNILQKIGQSFQDQKLKRMTLKLIMEIYWKLKMVVPTEAQHLNEIYGYIQSQRAGVKGMDEFERRISLYHQDKIDIEQLRQLLQSETKEIKNLEFIFDICRKLVYNYKGSNLIELLQVFRDVTLNISDNYSDKKSILKISNIY